MTAKEYCTSHDAIAYYSGLSGLEIHGIEYGVDDYVYCASGAWVGKYSYHRVKVLYSAKGDAYIRIHGYRIPLSDFGSLPPKGGFIYFTLYFGGI